MLNKQLTACLFHTQIPGKEYNFEGDQMEQNTMINKTNMKKTGFKLNRAKNDRIYAWALTLPALLVLAVTIFIPMLQVLRMSMYSYSMFDLNNIVWNNFENFTSVLRDKEFIESFERTLLYVFSTVIISFVIGLLSAILLNSPIKGRNIFRGVLFLPWAIPTVVAAVLWMWLYQPQYGVLNYILNQLHIVDKNINWLGQTNTAMGSIVIAAVWRQMPLMMVMLLSALQTVPKELEEAAIIDGANWFQSFRNVTIPCIMSVIKSVTLTSVVTNFQMFGFFFTMTNGGPVNSTTTLTLYTYQKAFMEFDMGKGSAIGVIWLAFLIVFASAYNKILGKMEVNSD